jgi:hypothetical protein
MAADEPKEFELEPPEEPNAEASPMPAPDPVVADVGAQDVDRLGAHLARALQDGGYHPVILFGTTFSGKTSLLLSLLSTLISEPSLETGIALCDPILGSETGIGRRLHDQARILFEVKTQAFVEGEKIPKTNVALPFFVPVELRPTGKPPVKFAFLESNGEWYRPLRERDVPLATAERLYPQLRTEIEDFVASFQGGISFIYLIPYTQVETYDDHDAANDPEQLLSASLAITGVLRAYDRIRANHRASDRHLMLVTKWDAHTARDPERAEGIQEDRDALNEFCSRKYAQAIATFQGLNLAQGQRQLNAYCSGIINKNGLLQLRPDDTVRDVIISYPIRLWNWLYTNALVASDLPIVGLFPDPPEPPALVRIWKRLLDFVSGR